jgi:FeS assembly SUF system regulator
LIRLSKIADYGVVLMAELASDPSRATHNARELAADVHLPVPVVSKVLKALARGGLLESHRGAKGGYQLARPAPQISVAEIVRALEGPIAITECNLGPRSCQHEVACALRSPWQRINQVVQGTLARVTLADLIDPAYVPVPAPAAPHAPLPLLQIAKDH